MFCVMSKVFQGRRRLIHCTFGLLMMHLIEHPIIYVNKIFWQLGTYIIGYVCKCDKLEQNSTLFLAPRIITGNP